jgi:hypothetical protein
MIKGMSNFMLPAGAIAIPSKCVLCDWQYKERFVIKNPNRYPATK